TIRYNEKWEQQKKIIKDLLSDEKTGAIYGKRKIDVEPVFGFLKANLCFTRFSVRGKEKVRNDLGFALMAVNMRKYAVQTALLGRESAPWPSKKGSNHQNSVIGTFFNSFQLVMSQPHPIYLHLRLTLFRI
ncbi:Transposase DDE domain-containing protein, partial [Trichococcus palustris]